MVTTVSTLSQHLSDLVKVPHQKIRGRNEVLKKSSQFATVENHMQLDVLSVITEHLC